MEPLSIPQEASRGRMTAHEYVMTTLRRAILGGQLPGGTRLVQSDVAKELDVSTTPVREALRDLAAEGLVRIDTHRETVVQQVDLAELNEIYGIRTVLESYCARLSVERITEDELELAASLQARMDNESLVATWVDLNREFHHLLVRASRSARLANILTNLQDAASIYVSTSLRNTPAEQRTGNAEHHAILDAYRARDRDAANEAILTHMNHTMAIVGATLSDGGAAAAAVKVRQDR